MQPTVMQPMSLTSENVSMRFGISRHEQDLYAVESRRTRAEAAQAAGWFRDEIMPITVMLKDRETGEPKQVMLVNDERIPPGNYIQGTGKN